MSNESDDHDFAVHAVARPIRLVRTHDCADRVGDQLEQVTKNAVDALTPYTWRGLRGVLWRLGRRLRRRPSKAALRRKAEDDAREEREHSEWCRANPIAVACSGLERLEGPCDACGRLINYWQSPVTGGFFGTCVACETHNVIKDPGLLTICEPDGTPVPSRAEEDE